MIVANRDWLTPTTFARNVETTLPLGKVYLPDCSYREMTEWVLPAHRLSAFEQSAPPVYDLEIGRGRRKLDQPAINAVSNFRRSQELRMTDLFRLKIQSKACLTLKAEF